MKMTMTLEKQQLFAIEHPGKMNIRCDSGHLWVTTGNNQADITLREGEKTAINSQQKLIVQSIIHSKISIHS